MIVFGATGGTGQFLVSGALQRGHAVTAFVRNAANVRLAAGLSVIMGDALEPAAVASAVANHDAVIFALGPRTLAPNPLLERAGTNVVEAMRRAGTKRLIVLGAAGALRDSGKHLSAVVRLGFATMKATILRNPMRMQARLQQIVETSDLHYTIVLPPRLLDVPPVGAYRVLLDGLPAAGLQIGRADLANFMLECLDQNMYIRQAPYPAY